jgi:hypothetical protein
MDSVSLRNSNRRLTIQKEVNISGEWWKVEGHPPVVLEDAPLADLTVSENERLVIELAPAQISAGAPPRLAVADLPNEIVAR